MVSTTLIEDYGKLLEDLGFTSSEVNVYFALLELGPSSTGAIVKKSRVGSGKVYQVLDKLILKGLVSYITKNKVKEFQAQDPDRLLDFVQEQKNKLDQKEAKLKEILPALKDEHQSSFKKIRAEMFEGIKGFKSCYEFILSEAKENEDILVLGAAKEAIDKYFGFLKEWNQRREEKGINMKILYNASYKQDANKNEFTTTKIKYLKEATETPAWTMIFQDYVITMHVRGTPICFLIKDEHTAASHKKQFELMWSNAEE